MHGRRFRSVSWEAFPGERLCRLALRLLALSFGLVGATFLFLPDATIEGMNAIGGFFGDFPPLSRSAERFWLTLATGYMALVAALAYAAQRDLGRHRDLLAFLALGKAVTALGGLGFYLGSKPAFLYLANFFVDGTIALGVMAIRRVVPSQDSLRGDAPASEGWPQKRESDPVFEALLEAMVPPGGPFPEGARESEVSSDLEAFVAGVGAERAFRLALRCLEFSPFVLPPYKFRRFSQLPLPERVELLECWEASRSLLRRQAVHILKLLGMTHFYSRPEIQARLGYPHPLDRVPRTEGAP